MNPHRQTTHPPGCAPTSDGSATPPPDRIRVVAVLGLVWSLGTVIWSLAWILDLLPQPFVDPGAVFVGAILNAAPTEMVGNVFTLALGMVGVLVAAAMLRTRGEAGRAGPAIETLGWILALTIATVLLHGKVLPLLGYLPVVLTLGWFDPMFLDAYLEALVDPEIHLQGHALVGIVLWASAARMHRRARRGDCSACGRSHDWSDGDEASTRVASLRRGRVAVVMASVAALAYPAIRLPWLAGIPVGMDAEAFAELQATPGMIGTGVALGVAAVAGIGLMSGLVRDWGVRFPRWLPGLASRRVPVGLAVVPATVVALALVGMGRGFLTAFATGRVPAVAASDWPTVLAFATMLPWGLALGVATVSYAQRRRSACTTCGHGHPEALPSELADLPPVARSFVAAPVDVD